MRLLLKVDRDEYRPVRFARPKTKQALSMQDFRQSVRSGAMQLGTFIKTPSHQIPEILGVSGLDFAIIDCEHAAFDVEALDRMALAARAAGLPCLVRIPELNAATIGQILDQGLSGIMVPHVKDPGSATAALAAAKYGLGHRGFSPSTRAAGHGTADPVAYRSAADRESSVWCQIEDAAALARLDDIAAIDQIDCLFLGRADLALSLKVEGQNDPKVVAAVAATAEAGRRHGRAIGIFIGDTAEIPDLLTLGITVFVCGSDQSFVLAQARRIRKEMSAYLAAKPAH
jgi:2-keto-3-deoxy-L-rhamnonate aldolase RhmA